MKVRITSIAVVAFFAMLAAAELPPRYELVQITPESGDYYHVRLNNNGR